MCVTSDVVCGVLFWCVFCVAWFGVLCGVMRCVVCWVVCGFDVVCCVVGCEVQCCLWCGLWWCAMLRVVSCVILYGGVSCYGCFGGWFWCALCGMCCSV